MKNQEWVNKILEKQSTEAHPKKNQVLKLQEGVK